MVIIFPSLSNLFLFFFLSPICCLGLLSFSSKRPLNLVDSPEYLLQSAPSFIFLVPLNFSLVPIPLELCVTLMSFLPAPPPTKSWCATFLSVGWRPNSLTHYSRSFIQFFLPSRETIVLPLALFYFFKYKHWDSNSEIICWEKIQ